jgi:CheY-like chemotaxis protein
MTNINDTYLVLIVEDNILTLKTTEAMLQKMNCRVELATDGLKAVEACSRQCYDLILMDCQMPVMDGFEATRRIRELENGGYHTPIIALTSTPSTYAKESCLEAGMDDFVNKPVTTEPLIHILKRWLQN